MNNYYIFPKPSPFYSPNGRIGRMQFWRFFLCSNLVLLLLSIIIFAAGLTPTSCNSRVTHLLPLSVCRFITSDITLLFLLISFIINFPHAAKRLHDIGHSAWNYTGVILLNISFFWFAFRYDIPFLESMLDTLFNWDNAQSGFSNRFNSQRFAFHVLFSLLGVIFSNIIFFIYLMLGPQPAVNKYGINPKSPFPMVRKDATTSKSTNVFLYIIGIILFQISSISYTYELSAPIITMLLVTLTTIATGLIILARVGFNGFCIFLPIAASSCFYSYTIEDFSINHIFACISAATQMTIWCVIGYAVVTPKYTAHSSTPPKMSFYTITMSALLLIVAALNASTTSNINEQIVSISTFISFDKCVMTAFTCMIKIFSFHPLFSTTCLWFITRELYRLARHTVIINPLTAKISASGCACLIYYVLINYVHKGNLAPMPILVSIFLAQFITYYILLGNEEKPAPTQKLPIAG